MASYIEKMEEAAGISTPSAGASGHKSPYGKGESIKSGQKAREWTGPRPWKDRVKGAARPL